MRKVLITGIGGQAGQFMAAYLLKHELDVQIIGTVRHKSYDRQPWIFDRDKITFDLLELSDPGSADALVSKYKPDFFINFAANAFVGQSWKIPASHITENTLGVCYQLEAIRKHAPECHYFNSGSSEEFGGILGDVAQNEQTEIHPRSPYGVSKAAARYLINVYRESYNLWAIQNWTFNFESELRSPIYVTRKVTLGAARIAKAIQRGDIFQPIVVGNLDSSRSWQYAGDVVDAIWKCVNNPRGPEGYVVGAAECHSIRELIEYSFKVLGITGAWQADAFISSSRVLAKTSPEFKRPNDVTFLEPDASKIKRELGWAPVMSFAELIRRMTEYDFEHDLTI